MSAEIKPRINLEDRTRLETVIPLSTPYLVFLDPSDICNFACSFCPTGDNALMSRTRQQQLLDWDLYKRIIKSLCQMPEPIKTLRLYGFGEPLLNPKFADMVAYARKTQRFVQIDTTTNGSLLKPDLGQRIIEAGLDALIVSVPADYSDKYRENIKRFYRYSGGRCRVYVKVIREALDNTAAAKFLVDFKDISDRIFIENQVNCWPNFNAGPDGTAGIYGQTVSSAPMICPYIFYSIMINSDGTVSSCFLDWNRSMVIGDLAQESFEAVWNGPGLRRLRLAHLLNQRSSRASCANCKQLQYGACDNIDAHADEVCKNLYR